MIEQMSLIICRSLNQGLCFDENLNLKFVQNNFRQQQRKGEREGGGEKKNFLILLYVESFMVT